MKERERESKRGREEMDREREIVRKGLYFLSIMTESIFVSCKTLISYLQYYLDIPLGR